MKFRLMSAALVAALAATFAVVRTPGLAAQSNQANQKRDAVVVPFSVPATDSGAAVTGTLSINRFVAQNGALFAVGTLAATIPDGTGTHTVIQEVTVPVSKITGGSVAQAAPLAQAQPAAVTQAQAASCSILHLELGPVDLNLLGLVVHLDRVVLDISAQPGSGNLLGNLLCQVAGLLDGNPLAGVLSQVVGLLNQILAAL